MGAGWGCPRCREGDRLCRGPRGACRAHPLLTLRQRVVVVPAWWRSVASAGRPRWVGEGRSVVHSISRRMPVARACGVCDDWAGAAPVAPSGTPPSLVLGDRPAVLARQVRQQPEYQLPHPTPRLDPREPARDPIHQALAHFLPTGGVYAVTCGHCVIFCLHTPMISGGRIRLRAGTRPQDHDAGMPWAG